MEIADEAGVACLTYLKDLLINELNAEMPNVARLSLALGIVESSLTAARDESERKFPTDLAQQVEEYYTIFQDFCNQLLAATSATSDPRQKVKIVADMIWLKLTGSFAKDVLHAQHVYNFTKFLQPEAAKSPKRHLCCAGVTTTTYAACNSIGIPVYMQVSEDHCFLNLCPEGGREGSVEVTTDTAAKRALPAELDLWTGWLYAGGHAVMCTPKQALAAVVTSITPLIAAGKKSSTCERLQALQFQLLSTIKETAPEAMYPAAICAIADLHEIVEEDAVEAALEGRNEAAVLEAVLLKDDGSGALGLFKQGIALSTAQAGEGEAVGWNWYPYSYIFGFLCRRAELIQRCVAAMPYLGNQLAPAALAAFKQALQWAADGSGVLARYKFNVADEELYKDVGEGVLESCCDGLTVFAKSLAAAENMGASAAKVSQEVTVLVPLLTYWDGICVLFAARGKPAHWVSMLLKTLKLFSSEARAEAAVEATARSSAMQKARPLWEALKPKVLQPIFDLAEVQEGGAGMRPSKRARGS